MIRRNQRGFSMLNATLAVALATTGTAGALVYNAGAIRVQVQEMEEGGENINLIVPAAIVPVALAFLPDEAFGEVSAEMRDALPIVEAAGKALQRLPDFVLVEVQERDEHVRVEKLGDSFHVKVDSDSEKVHVSFPVHMIVSVANRLASLPPGRALDLEKELKDGLRVEIDGDQEDEL